MADTPNDKAGAGACWATPKGLAVAAVVVELPNGSGVVAVLAGVPKGPRPPVFAALVVVELNPNGAVVDVVV